MTILKSIFIKSNNKIIFKEGFLKDYMSSFIESEIFDLLREHKTQLILSKPRTSKLGDFRAKPCKIISINKDLNPDLFLIVLLHEIAHAINYNIVFRKKPHGKEWKEIFSRLLFDFIKLDAFSEKNINEIKSIANNPKSSLSINNLLIKNENNDPDFIPLYNLNLGDKFIINNKKIFVLGELRRKRYKCYEPFSGKNYLVSSNALVKLLKNH